MRCAGELDPSALSQLPTSIQIELMGKYRERQTMLNRSRFQETSSDAQAFSGLQMATYLKQTELRRKVDKLKDDEASKGAERMPAQPDSVFVLKDHAKGAVHRSVPVDSAVVASDVPVLGLCTASTSPHLCSPPGKSCWGSHLMHRYCR